MKDDKLCCSGVFSNILFILVSVSMSKEVVFEFELVFVSDFLELEEMIRGYDVETGWKGRYLYLFVCAILVSALVGD